MKNTSSTTFGRRAFLGAGISAGLASMFLRPLEAAAANGPPKRFLMIHRPCGTVPDRFFPVGGSTTDFTLGPIMSPLESFKSDMVMFSDVHASRLDDWQGDRHGQGLISCVTGSRAISDGEPITTDDQFHHITGASKSIDQILLSDSPLFKGARAVHLGSYRDSVQGGRIYPEGGAANFRPISYAGANMPIFPEVRPTVALQTLFGNAMPGGADAIARQQKLNKSILDLVAKDIGALQKQTPASQRSKLDAHLAAIQQLESQIAAQSTSKVCAPPMVQPQLTDIPPGTMPGLRIDALEHTVVSKEQLNIIKVGFECDLIRVATFSFGHGNSDVQFAPMLPNFGTLSGFHEISHLTDSAAVDRLAAVDTYYCQRLAEFLTDLKNTADSDGSSMLDNTLVVFFSDVSWGFNHSSDRMPFTFFGGKSLGLTGGRNLKMNGRYMNDIWASTLHAFGVPLPSDNMFGGNNVWNGVTGPRLGSGAVSGIFS
jgi:hypothetical protein